MLQLIQAILALPNMKIKYEAPPAPELAKAFGETLGIDQDVLQRELEQMRKQQTEQMELLRAELAKQHQDQKELREDHRAEMEKMHDRLEKSSKEQKDLQRQHHTDMIELQGALDDRASHTSPPPWQQQVHDFTPNFEQPTMSITPNTPPHLGIGNPLVEASYDPYEYDEPINMPRHKPVPRPRHEPIRQPQENRSTHSSSSSISRGSNSSFGGSIRFEVSSNPTGPMKANDTPDMRFKANRAAAPRAERAIQIGPRGGKYYINSNGNKSYVK